MDVDNRKKWTDEEIDVLKKYGLDYSDEYIAELLNRTPLSVKVKRKNLKLY